ncbi:MAG: outer membrane beta-barrel protein [Bacteroidota bacterium]
MLALRVISICFFLSITNLGFGQRTKLPYLPDYEYEWLHFGFTLGINQSNFILFPADVANNPDSVLSVESLPELGFNLGIIADLKLHQYATLRFIPALSFQDRSIEYTIHYFSPSDAVLPLKKKVESTLLDFPLNLKIRSERMNNLAGYLLTGGKVSIDLASQKNTKNPELVKLNSTDWSFEVGGGIDFYFEFFKFSTEIKFSVGLKDRLIHEPTLYSYPINKLITKIWLISINFEG